MVEAATDIQQSEREPRVYELGYHLVPTTPEERLPEEVGRIKDLLVKKGAVVISEEFPKKIELAYTMAKAVGSSGKLERHDNAYFGWVKFELNPQVQEEVKKDLEGVDTLLRFLIIQTVREDTLAPKRRVFQKTDEKEKGEKMTEAEIDRTIEELVVE